MSDQQDEFGFRPVAISAIRTLASHAKPKPKKVTELAESIRRDGLLEPIGVRPDPDSEGGYVLVFGATRLKAVQKLGEDAIDAKVMDIGPDEAEAATAAENIYRRELTREERYEAVAVWAACYKASNPESDKAGRPKGPRAPKAADPAAAPDAGENPSESEGLSADRVRSAPRVLSAVTGVGETRTREDVAIAEKFTADQRKAMIEREVPHTQMAALAKVKDADDRGKAVNLVVSGMPVASAIAAAQAPPGATVEAVEQADAEGFKPEADMTDDEWLETYCGEALRRLKFPAAYRAEAALYRQTREVRAKFKAGIKKALAKVTGGNRGPFHYLLTRIVDASHPRDWPICGPCGGTSTVEGGGTCPKCRGNGYQLKIETK